MNCQDTPGTRYIHRWKQFLLIGSTLLGSWLGMQAVHELGHITGAWLTGGNVTKVVLHPLTISRTDLVENPAPLIVVWAGPVLGCFLPLLTWVTAARCRMPHSFLLRFFAGFCLIANGAYIAVGSWDGIGDCGEMLRNGSPLWHLWAFGLITVPAGFRLWHGLGPHFGLGPAKGQVCLSAAMISLAASLLLIIQGLLVGGD